MRRSLPAVVLTAASLLVGSIALAPVAGAEPSTIGLTHQNVRVCAAPTPGRASCDAVRRDTFDRNGRSVTVAGYGPDQLAAAYSLPAPRKTDALQAVSGTAPVVAIVDAYDHPNAAADLATYRKQYNLPDCPAGSCFLKVNQTGTTGPLPRANGSWAQEISLDLDMASAACPTCRILLVEANSNSFDDLAAAVDAAAAVSNWAPAAISNSYGAPEAAGFAAAYGKAYDKPGIAVTVSTGDNGYQVQVPAALPTVVAVGGTTLKQNAKTKAFTETAWTGAGSGCSLYSPVDSFQDQAVTRCGTRATADVSAVADPATGVAVYDSYNYLGRSGWMVFGGTSASAPFIAGLYALAGTPAGYAADYTWRHAAGLRDVDAPTANGTCAPSLWCTSGPGWDGPTGLGVPRGLSAFGG